MANNPEQRLSIEEVLQNNEKALKAANQMLQQVDDLYKSHGVTPEAMSKIKLTPFEEAKAQAQVAEFEEELEKHKRQARELAKSQAEQPTKRTSKKKHRAFV